MRFAASVAAAGSARFVTLLFRRFRSEDTPPTKRLPVTERLPVDDSATILLVPTVMSPDVVNVFELNAPEVTMLPVSGRIVIVL